MLISKYVKTLFLFNISYNGHCFSRTIYFLHIKKSTLQFKGVTEQWFVPMPLAHFECLH